jgi:hypothetical protein
MFSETPVVTMGFGQEFDTNYELVDGIVFENFNLVTWNEGRTASQSFLTNDLVNSTEMDLEDFTAFMEAKRHEGYPEKEAWITEVIQMVDPEYTYGE